MNFLRIKKGLKNFQQPSIMLEWFKYRPALPPLSNFRLKPYRIRFALDGLILGVDNLRHDVNLSPTFCSATSRIVSQLILRHLAMERKSSTGGREGWLKQVEDYKQLYRQMMRDAIDQAKARDQLQVECLAQTAVIKMLIGEVRKQYEDLVRRLKSAVRKSDLAVHNDASETPKLKERLSRVLQLRPQVLLAVGKELAGYLADVQQGDLREAREAVFGPSFSFAVDILRNPLLFAENPYNDFFMLAEYDLNLGRRIEDPDKYDSLLALVQELLGQLDDTDPGQETVPVDRRLQDAELEEYGRKKIAARRKYIDRLLRNLKNINRLLDWETTRDKLGELKRKKHEREAIVKVKSLMKDQRRLLKYFHRQFRRKALMQRISAAYLMQPEYKQYCPPLVPQQIMQYMISSRGRKAVKQRLKRLNKLYGRSFNLKPLNRKAKQLRHLTAAEQRRFLLRFLNAFCRLHRDLRNFELIKEGMERVNLLSEEKLLSLSRENNTLYEFLLPHEQSSEEAPIINHVVIKADVRGSTDLTYRMNKQGMNPATYFSLNFFDPISQILSEYNTVKVFIEGDAIILSIFERRNRPADWYSVARACGVALNILMIIGRCNENNKRHRLPVLELGLGISYIDKAPTFLFDGNNRIMISSAINQADRLSGCAKQARRILRKNKTPFNLFVFQTASDQEMAATRDDLFLRYNVNGIELNQAGFEKLSREIDLKMIKGNVPDLHTNKVNLYTGRFPTKSGRFQRLVIREAQVPVVDPDNLSVRRITSRKYYEVCTHPLLYKLARSKAR